MILIGIARILQREFVDGGGCVVKQTKPKSFSIFLAYYPIRDEFVAGFTIVILLSFKLSFKEIT
jgi:hypothetical protein